MLHLLKEHQDLWDKLKEETRPIVLYGMGNGADKILEVCARYGIAVQGVFASDGFVRGHAYRGYPVLSMDELERRLRDFIVLLSFATARAGVLRQIEAVARRHTLYAPDLPVAGDILFTREYLEENASLAEESYSLLADEESRRVYLDILNYKISGDISYLKHCESAKETVFETIFPLGGNEIFVDAGAYNGDTVKEFLRCAGGKYERIYAFEPDRRNFKKLETAIKTLQAGRAVCKQAGVWDRADTLSFSHSSGRQSALDERGVPTPMDSIDNLLGGAPATYIKYDVEGAEARALRGSAHTIRAYAPKLLVSAYHRSDDLLVLPRLIHSLHPGYRLHLRHHPYIPAWDTNLYAVPGGQADIRHRA